MSIKKVECEIISVDEQGKSAQVRLLAGEMRYLLVMGIRGLIDPTQFNGEEILLIDGLTPMSKEDWCLAALSANLGEALPCLTLQQDLT